MRGSKHAYTCTDNEDLLFLESLISDLEDVDDKDLSSTVAVDDGTEDEIT